MLPPGTLPVRAGGAFREVVREAEGTQVAVAPPAPAPSSSGAALGLGIGIIRTANAHRVGVIPDLVGRVYGLQYERAGGAHGIGHLGRGAHDADEAALPAGTAVPPEAQASARLGVFPGCTAGGGREGVLLVLALVLVLRGILFPHRGVPPPRRGRATPRVAVIVPIGDVVDAVEIRRRPPADIISPTTTIIADIVIADIVIVVVAVASEATAQQIGEPPSAAPLPRREEMTLGVPPLPRHEFRHVADGVDAR
jgi:hypothetical protein